MGMGEEVRETVLSYYRMTPLPTIIPLKCGAAMSKKPEFSGNLRLILQSRHPNVSRLSVNRFGSSSPTHREKKKKSGKKHKRDR